MISNKNKKVTSPYLQGLWVLLVQEDKALSFVGPGKGECLAAHGAGSQVSGAGKRIFSSGSTAEAAGVCTFQRSAARILDSWRTGSGQMLLPLACPLLPAGCFPLWFSHLYPSGWCWALSLWREIVKMASAPHGTHWVFPGGRQSLTQKKKKNCVSLSHPLYAFQHIGFPFWMLPLAAVSQEPQEWTVSVWNHPASPCPVTVALIISLVLFTHFPLAS